MRMWLARFQLAASARYLITSEESDPGSPRIPGVNHRSAGDEIMKGAMLMLHENS